ncbi:hypothetical protein GCM10022251_14080 [Phytohabitans flavus]|uniref:Uncharacterized protein n=1 Tax=Phytohabitans flavus TaxID=1076124 RepID=A0A6F8XIX6_9ACTN|nr:hypothetical protein [Phytohabitans flavus]BCB73766.1 hypothetical protein Pflav_001760 [Phytohabitans flavus]
MFDAVDTNARLLISAEVHEIESLYEWLCMDRGLARVAAVSPADSRDPSSMSTLELINVILTHVGAAANLALALAAWRQSRSDPGVVTVTRPDGQVLTIGGSAEVTSELIVAFLSTNAQEAVSPTSQQES